MIRPGAFSFAAKLIIGYAKTRGIKRDQQSQPNSINQNVMSVQPNHMNNLLTFKFTELSGVILFIHQQVS
jgi:hypothetical protein